MISPKGLVYAQAMSHMRGQQQCLLLGHVRALQKSQNVKAFQFTYDKELRE